MTHTVKNLALEPNSPGSKFPGKLKSNFRISGSPLGVKVKLIQIHKIRFKYLFLEAEMESITCKSQL